MMNMTTTMNEHEHDEAIETLKLAIREAVEEIKDLSIVTTTIDSEIAAIKAEVRESARLKMLDIMKASGIDPSEYNELMKGVASSSSDSATTKPTNRQHLVFDYDGKTYGVYRGKGSASGFMLKAIEAGQDLKTMKARGAELSDDIKRKLEATAKEFIDITDML